MNTIEPEITKNLLIKAKKTALRNGKWFKLHPAERAVISLSCKLLTKIRSKTLKEIIIKILEKISKSLLLSWKIVSIGYEITKKRVEQALKLSHYKAVDWLKDFSYIWYSGWNYINTPPMYK